MKKQNKNSVLSEVIGYFGDPGRKEPFFDDCPICQELKRKIEAGELEMEDFEMESES